MFEDIHIRLATNEDSSKILHLIGTIWINEYKFEINLQDFPDLHQILRFYSKEKGLFLVAVWKDKIIGTLACSKLMNDTFVLKRMFVHQDFRKNGIAQRLLEVLLKEKMDETFYLSTKEEVAAAAKNFYLKNGFKIITKEELPKDFPFFYEDDLFMKR